MLEHAVSGTAGLLSRPVLLTCSAPRCTELVRKRARFCAAHVHKWEERGHDGRGEGERPRRESGTATDQGRTLFSGAEEQRGEGGSTIYSPTAENRRAATERRDGDRMKRNSAQERASDER